MREIYKKMRRANGVSYIVGGILCCLLGCSMLYCLAGSKNSLYFLPHKAMNKCTADKLEREKWYKVDINEIYDYYGTSDDGTYYIIPVKNSANEDTYMGLFVYKKDEALAAKICEETNEAINNDLEFSSKHLKGKGYAYDMSLNERAYFKGYFDSIGASKEVKDNLVYKTIELYPLSETINFKAVIGYIFGGALLVLGIGLALYFVTGAYISKFKKSIKKGNISEYDIENDYAVAGNVENKITIGNKYLITYAKPALIELDKLVWAYKRIKKNSQTEVTLYSVMLCDRDKKTYEVSLRTEENADKAIGFIEQKAPYVIIGYSNDKVKIYKNNFNEMVNYVDERKLGNMN